MTADPTRPYKAIAAAVIAGAGVAIAQGSDILPPWVILVLAVLIAGLGTFLVPNPQAPPESTQPPERYDGFGAPISDG